MTIFPVLLVTKTPRALKMQALKTARLPGLKEMALILNETIKVMNRARGAT